MYNYSEIITPATIKYEPLNYYCYYVTIFYCGGLYNLNLFIYVTHIMCVFKKVYLQLYVTYIVYILLIGTCS